MTHERGIDVVRAGRADLDRLVALMAEFYAESDFRLNPVRATVAFGPLLDRGDLGQVWLLRAGGDAVGYVALTFCWSLECGGTCAYVDDLFVRRDFRRRGLGRLALERVRAECEALGVRAVHVEVDRANDAAQSVYRAAGFDDVDRQRLSLPLLSPTHAAD
jgi:GNAT superfamily N-acetyltransferase